MSEDRDDGRKIYEIRFDVAEKEYDYEILASDGSVISSDIETNENYAAPSDGTASQNGTAAQVALQGRIIPLIRIRRSLRTAAQGNSGASSNTQQNSGAGNANVAISMEDAIGIALARVEGATEQDIRIELDYDDGRYKYEGEIIHEMIEYDFEIDANTGTILEWSVERRLGEYGNIQESRPDRAALSMSGAGNDVLPIY